MKTKQQTLLAATAFLFIATIIVTISCNKKFDAPPDYIDPNITATTTIKALKAAHVSGATETLTGNEIIAGVVVANDSSGNFYKQIIIQDSTGGIAVGIDDYNLYTSFPVGRKVYVKTNGLFMADDNALIYLGFTPDAGGALSAIPSRLREQYIVKGETNQPVTPVDVTVPELTNQHQYMLIRLQHYEFAEADTAKTFSDAITKSTVSYTVQDCSGSNSRIVIRTSGYCNFAGTPLPNGNGALTAIYTVYKTTKQLLIRSANDAQFTNTRCDGIVIPGEVKTIKQIRDLYSGTDLKLNAYKVGGVVISDAASKNVTNGLTIIQSGGYGISVYLGGTITYAVGDSIILNLSAGDSLLNYRGSLEIKTHFGFEKPAPVATGKIVTPKEVTTKFLSDNITDLEFTLVKIKDAFVLEAPTTYAGSKTLTDLSGNMTLYTTATAAFAFDVMPAATADWVGYASTFGSAKQLQMRNTADVTNSDISTPATPDLLISEYLEGTADNKYLEIYNAGTTAADLSRYQLKLYLNGEATVKYATKLDTLFTATTLPPGGILVLKNAKAALTLPAAATSIHNALVCGFNGDDAVTLEKDGMVIDVFGVPGKLPTGSAWDIAGKTNAAAEHAIRRNVEVTAGNVTWSISSTTGWNVNAQNDVSGLGVR